VIARAGRRALPDGVLFLVASLSFLDSHIFWPRGVLTMIGVAAGMSLSDYASSAATARVAVDVVSGG
jgi:hypothetical protein